MPITQTTLACSRMAFHGPAGLAHPEDVINTWDLGPLLPGSTAGGSEPRSAPRFALAPRTIAECGLAAAFPDPKDYSDCGLKSAPGNC